MGLPEIASTAAGLVLLPMVFYDLFQTVVLPRPAVHKFQLARYIIRPMWTVWRWVALRSSRVDRSETRLAARETQPCLQFPCLRLNRVNIKSSGGLSRSTPMLPAGISNLR